MLTLLAAELALGATRVFHDDFESDLSSVWQADGDRAKCTTESNSADQTPPHSGSRMLQCNWNGAVDWNDPEAYRALVLSSWKYDAEFFIRYWVRYDADVDHAFGNKLMRLGSQWFNELYLAGQMEQAPVAPMFSFFESLGGSEGSNVPGPMSYGDDTQGFGDGSWHQVEIHIRQNSPGQSDGSVKLWLDDVVTNEGDNLVTVASGKNWYPLYVMSNWSSNGPEWAHDETNHTYWDDMEIFSDDETGDPATGSMADGTITAGDEPTPNDGGKPEADSGAEPVTDAGVPPVGDGGGKPASGADAATQPNKASSSDDDGGCSTSGRVPRQPLGMFVAALACAGFAFWRSARRRLRHAASAPISAVEVHEQRSQSGEV